MVRLSQRTLGCLASGVILCGQPATAAPIDTGVGGFVNFAYAAEGPAKVPTPDRDGRFDGEIHVGVEGETDTGVTYAGRLQLLPAAKPRDNGAFAAIGWAWGEVRIGDYGGAAKELSVSAPTIGIGQIDGDLDRFGAPSALIAPYALANDDSTKLTYLSPAILGFRAGMSYTPDLADGGIEIARRGPPGPHADANTFELAFSSARDFGETTITTGAAYVIGAARHNVHLHDLDGGSIGSKLAWNGFTLGGAFVYDGARTLPLDRRPGHASIESIVSEINAGLTYETGRWKLDASWAHDYRKATLSTDMVAVGIVYRILPGVTIAADLARFTLPNRSEQGQIAFIIEPALHF